MKRISLPVVIVLAACLVGPFWAQQAPEPQPGAPPGAQGEARPVPKVTINTAGAPILGFEGAKITVVVFSDFQWPYCSRAVPVAKQLLQAYPKDVKVAFKHFPLAFHPYARGAAIAAVVAQRQNKFWEMHDILFQNQRALDAPSLRRYAEAIGLDMAAYDRGISDPEIARFVDQEVQDAQKAGTMGTPTVFVNGVQSPSYAFETLKRLVDVTLAGGDASLEAGKILAEVRAAQAKARTPQQVAPDFNKVYEIDTAGSPSKGPSGAPVTIVVFSDYQWPFCATAEPLLNQILEAYPKDVRLVFKHFPLNMHPQARPAAEATLFAGRKGKFWEMHDLIFKNNSRIGMDLFKELARQIGIDEKALEQSVATQAFKAQIDKDLLDGQKAGVTGTPTIFLNGKRVPRRDLETFKRLIDEVLASKGPAAK